MTPKRRSRCGRCAQWSKESQTIRLLTCDHIVCWTCLATICVKAVCVGTKAKVKAAQANTANEKPSADSTDLCFSFIGALCASCNEEIPLDVVRKVLAASSFQQYRSMRKVLRGDCISCSNVERKSELRVMTCGHFYCKECVRRMCRLSLGDRALVPLRCCQKEIPMDYIREALPNSTDYTLYERFLREKNWKESDLVSDAEYSKVVQCAGGKQCPGCGIGVQRDFGCVHIKCPNGHEFCFTCLRVWQTCRCPLIPDAELNEILHD